MKYIELSGKHGRGKKAIVDDEDYEYLKRWRWHVAKRIGSNGVSWYACRQGRNPHILNKRGQPKQVHISMARLIMRAEPGKQVDHKDGDTLDNRRSNLRRCTQQQNLWNQRWVATSNSPYKGVYKTSGKRKGFRGMITKDGVCVNLGWFKFAGAAARTYDKLAKLLFGEYANLNFPEKA